MLTVCDVDFTIITMDGMLDPQRTIRLTIHCEILTDSRFADKKLPDEEKLPHLTAMMQTYLSTMADIGAETWIMHGTLLGWWWNEKVSPYRVGWIV